MRHTAVLCARLHIAVVHYINQQCLYQMLKRVATKSAFFGAMSYVLGNVIGSGIFITPTGILRRTNSVGLSLIIWIVSGIVSALGSFVNLELGTSIQESGGDFAYHCYVKWYPVAFAFMWVRITANILVHFISCCLVKQC